MARTATAAVPQQRLQRLEDTLFERRRDLRQPYSRSGICKLGDANPGLLVKIGSHWLVDLDVLDRIPGANLPPLSRT
jgi:hypothetical protein